MIIEIVYIFVKISNGSWNKCHFLNPLTPKIWLLILSSSC